MAILKVSGIQKSGRTSEEINQTDVAMLNLLCASGLPGAEALDIPESLALLDRWTESVKASIVKNQHRFWSDPSEYRHSESLFKMIMLVLTLQQDLKVHYDRTMMGAAIGSDDPEVIKRDLADHSYFRDPKSIFLHGILSEERRGTCSSMPVLYVAIARRLGFPVKLVTTMGHLFVRWEGNGERFNIEGTGDGVDSPPDEYYMKWPLPVSEEAVAKGLYLKSLSPAEELAVFLESRAICLKENQRSSEAMVAIAQANRLRPNHFNTEVGLAGIAEIVTTPVSSRGPTPRQLHKQAEIATEALALQSRKNERDRLLQEIQQLQGHAARPLHEFRSSFPPSVPSVSAEGLPQSTSFPSNSHQDFR